MRYFSTTAWNIANKFSSVLASETRDLAALIDDALNVKDNRIAQQQEANACIPELEAEIVRLRAALNGLLDKHCELVNSGDCGFWDVEGEGAVIAARRALGTIEQKVGENK